MKVQILQPDIKDYTVARSGCGIIRLSRDRVLRVTGPDAIDVIDALFSIEMLLPYRGGAGAFLNDEGLVIAFATLFVGGDGLIIFTQDITFDALMKYLGEFLDMRDAEIVVLSDTHDIICLLGPDAEKTMVQNVSEDIMGLSYLTYEEISSIGQPVFRMGYTGEYEYRVLVPRGDMEIIKRLSQPGDDFTVSEISEDVFPFLMLEMRSLTYNELNEERCLLAAGMHWMIDFRKPEFSGKESLKARLDTIEQTGLMLRFGMNVPMMMDDALRIEGQKVGRIVKSIYSPTLGEVIALAYIDRVFSWVGVRFEVEANSGLVIGQGVSSPIFMTRTILDS